MEMTYGLIYQDPEWHVLDHVSKLRYCGCYQKVLCCTWSTLIACTNVNRCEFFVALCVLPAVTMETHQNTTLGDTGIKCDGTLGCSKCKKMQCCKNVFHWRYGTFLWLAPNNPRVIQQLKKWHCWIDSMSLLFLFLIFSFLIMLKRAWKILHHLSLCLHLLLATMVTANCA